MPYWRTFYHLISATENRQPAITSEIETLLNRSFTLTAEDLGLIIHAVGYMPDHVHMTLSIPPRLSGAEAVRRIKGASTHRVNEQCAESSFGWQGEYGIVTFAERDLSKVNHYVLNQKSRHAEGKTIE